MLLLLNLASLAEVRINTCQSHFRSLVATFIRQRKSSGAVSYQRFSCSLTTLGLSVS